MCTSPILIRNRRLCSLNVDVPNTFIKVPCGTCDECLRKRAKDLFVRARFEAQTTIQNGGCGFMCTLTYDNNCVPKLLHDGVEYMVFNKKHVIDFIKRVRTKLDRHFQNEYNCNAPDFKYLVTSEFGTDPTRSHRPHYHLIFLFKRPISYYIFNLAYEDSFVNHKTNKRVFGRIYHCEPLDLKRGGVRYSCKYILKDQTYNNQNTIISKLIKFHTDMVNKRFGIIDFPTSQDDYFYNKCIRSRKDYKKAIEKEVKPYRYMLQFYMCSNDFGTSSIIDFYGESLYSLGVLNIDSLPYSIPKSVIQKVERDEGTERRDILCKSIFMKRFREIVEQSIHDNYVNREKGEQLYYFCQHFIMPRFGSLYFINPRGLSFANRFFDSPLSVTDEILEEFRFYDDNNFFILRNEVYSLINLSNSSEKLVFRARIAKAKSEKEREDYKKKKYNNPSFY